MSYISTNETLNIGNPTSSTVNMNSSATLNLGGSSNVNINSTLGSVNITSGSNGSVNIKAGTGSGVNGNNVSINGLPILLSGNNTGFFTILSALSYYSNTTNFYLLPYTTSQHFLIQWGYSLDPGDGNDDYTYITFPIVFAAVPYVFAQQYAGTSLSSASNNNIVVRDVSSTQVIIDSAYSNQNKYPIAWIALGLYNI
jgi:hypothetical protein